MTKLNNFEMMDIVKNRVADLMDSFRAKFGDNCKYKPVDPNSIIFTKKGTTAGTACTNPYTGECELNFNLQIMKDNWDKFDNTIIHEVAHYTTFLIHGVLRTGRKRVIHGQDWKNQMAFLGGSQSRCHSYDVSNARSKRQRRWNYKCGCQTHEIATVTHNRIQKGTRGYFCKACKGKLEYMG